MSADGKPLLGPLQPLLGLSLDLSSWSMAGTRNNKTARGRISRPTRAIFYDNLEKGLRGLLPGASQAEKIRWLMANAFLSRTHAQRLIKENRDPDLEQAPSIDTLAFIAEAFGVTPADFLRQGCRFNATQKPEHMDASLEVLQRGKGRAATGH